MVSEGETKVIALSFYYTHISVKSRNRTSLSKAERMWHVINRSDSVARRVFLPPPQSLLVKTSLQRAGLLNPPVYSSQSSSTQFKLLDQREDRKGKLGENESSREYS